MDLDRIKDEVCATSRKMLELGLVAGTWGNVSRRVNSESMVITPSGMDYDKLDGCNMVLVQFEGLGYEGPLKPSVESALHAAVYRARPDVGAIVHTHSLYACAASVLRSEIPVILEEMAQLLAGSVCTAEYALAGTDELAACVVRALGSCNAVLLANHGAVACGRDLKEALLAVQVVEKACRVWLEIKKSGEAHALTPEQTDHLRDFYLHRYGQFNRE